MKKKTLKSVTPASMNLMIILATLGPQGKCVKLFKTDVSLWIYITGRFSIRSMSILQRSNMDRTNQKKQKRFLSYPPEEKQFEFFGDIFFCELATTTMTNFIWKGLSDIWEI